MLSFSTIGTVLSDASFKLFIKLMAICFAVALVAAFVVFEAGYSYFWEFFSFMLIATICSMIICCIVALRPSKPVLTQPEQ